MRKCGGLPLALIVIGRTMTCKTTTHDWEHAIEVLKRYAAEFSTIKDEVFTPLKYSFDNLPNSTIRSCFLYCSLYAEDEEIVKGELVDKWICEDLLGRLFDDLHNARNEGLYYINILVHASLLEECSPVRVKMHDVIRYMSLWIGGDTLCVKAQANNGICSHAERMSLMGHHIGELNGRTKFLNLKTMFLKRAGLSSISNDFMKFAPNLKVLDLSSNEKLTSFRKEFCELIFLQYLNLESTNIQEVPSELKRLVKLKYLNLEYTKIFKIPEGVLSSLKELSVFKCGAILVRNCDFLSENLVKEMEGLEYLQDVTITANSKAAISNLASSIKLLNCITGLTLTSFSDSIYLDLQVVRVMKHLQLLHIATLEKVEKIVVEEQGLQTFTIKKHNDFNSLRSLVIDNCWRLKNLSCLVFFHGVEEIYVTNCPEMQTLVSEDEYKTGNKHEPLARLRRLVLTRLPKLESICVTALSFPHLHSLEVDRCEELKQLPFNSSSCEGCGVEIKATSNWWYALRWEDEATQITFSSSFESRV